MFQETSSDVSWAFFCLLHLLSLFPLTPTLPPILSHCIVIPFGMVAALSLSHPFGVSPIPTPRAVAHGSGSQCCGGGHHCCAPVTVVSGT